MSDWNIMGPQEIFPTRLCVQGQRMKMKMYYIDSELLHINQTLFVSRIEDARCIMGSFSNMRTGNEWISSIS